VLQGVGVQVPPEAPNPMKIPIHAINSFPVKRFPKKDLKGKYCLSPFVQVGIGKDFVGMCGCMDWLPTSIGNIFDDDLDALLSSDVAQDIRKSIIDGTYEFCDAEKCGVIREGKLNDYEGLPPEVKWAIEDPARYKKPFHIVLYIDETCNLSCPSCRHDIIKNNAEVTETNKHASKIIANNLLGVPTDHRIELTLDTSGDVFASQLQLNFLSSINIQDFPNLEIDLLTNGLLAKRRWGKMGDAQQRVSRITVSYDSPDPTTYERLRRGGKFTELVENLTFLKEKKQENGMQFKVRMVVQKENYQQMLDFYEFSQQFDVDEVQFQRILNWGSFTPKEFETVDVFNPDSSNYSQAIEEFKRVANLPNTVFWHGMPKV
jgi:hypothetical protein